jgi:hypothetical protein
MRLGVTSALAAIVLAAVAAAATASTFYAVKRGGLWYWSPNIPAALFAPNESGQTPYYHPHSTDLVKDMGLTRDEKLELEAQLAQVALDGHPQVVAKLNFAPTSTVCHGSRPSIASPDITVDLFHEFGCTMHGASYARLPIFQNAIKKARAALAAAASPKPQPLLDAFIAAYANRTRYLLHGDPKTLRFTLIVTGRRAYTVAK